MKISFFETRTRNSFFQSRASRRERKFPFSILCFETRTRNRKSFLMVKREKIKLILTRIPGIENSRYALLYIILGRQLEDTFENTRWRKVKQMHSVQFCIISGREVEDTFKNTLWRKVWQHFVGISLHYIKV